MRSLLVAALAMLTVSVPAWAEDRPAPPTAEQTLARVDHELDEVGATDAQREAVHALVQTATEQREAFREEAHGLRARFADLLWADTIDRAALEQVREQAVDLFDRATAFGLDHLVKVAEVLTPEQRREVHDHLAR